MLSGPEPAGRRAIGVDLILFFLFALAALVMLTRITVSANEIDRDILASVNPPLTEISESTALLPALERTGELTSSIVTETAPLRPDLDAIVASTDGIRTSVYGIESDVTAILRSVTSIDGTAAAIRVDVGTAEGPGGLAPLIAGIRAKAAQTSARYADVLGDVRAVEGFVRKISSSMSSVVENVGPIGHSVSGIDGRLHSVDRHVDNIEKSPILQLSNTVELHDILTGRGGGINPRTGIGALTGGGR